MVEVKMKVELELELRYNPVPTEGSLKHILIPRKNAVATIE
jgi:hypothetical protein